MTRKTFFHFPGSRRIENSSDDFLRGALLDADEKTWHHGGDEGAIEIEEERSSSILILVLREPFGFFLTTWVDGDAVVAVGDRSLEGTVDILEGQGPHTVWKRNFLARHLALEAVLEYKRTGQLSRSVQWEPHDPPESAHGYY